jgi:single-strand DNA-binding protein
MSRGLNKVMIIGYLGKAPEMRFTPNGISVANFSLACDRSRKDTDGNKHTSTEWFNIVAWGSLAEIAKENLVKDSQVYVEGRLQSRTWQDKEGHQHRSFEIVACDLLMLNNQQKHDLENSKEIKDYPF